MKFKYIIICFIIYIHKFISTHGSIFKNEVFRNYITEDSDSNSEMYDDPDTKIGETENNSNMNENITDTDELKESPDESIESSDESVEKFQKNVENKNREEELNKNDLEEPSDENPREVRPFYQSKTNGSLNYYKFGRNFTTPSFYNNKLTLNFSTLMFQTFPEILKNKRKEKIINRHLINKNISNTNINKKIENKLKESNMKFRDDIFLERDLKTMSNHKKCTKSRKQPISTPKKLLEITNGSHDSLSKIELNHVNISLIRKIENTSVTKRSTEKIKLINDDPGKVKLDENGSQTEELPTVKSCKSTRSDDLSQDTEITKVNDVASSKEIASEEAITTEDDSQNGKTMTCRQKISGPTKFGFSQKKTEKIQSTTTMIDGTETKNSSIAFIRSTKLDKLSKDVVSTVAGKKTTLDENLIIQLGRTEILNYLTENIPIFSIMSLKNKSTLVQENPGITKTNTILSTQKEKAELFDDFSQKSTNTPVYLTPSRKSEKTTLNGDMETKYRTENASIKTLIFTESPTVVDTIETPSCLVNTKEVGNSFPIYSPTKIEKPKKPYLIKIGDYNSSELAYKMGIARNITVTLHKTIQIPIDTDLETTTSVSELSSNGKKRITKESMNPSMVKKSFDHQKEIHKPTVAKKLNLDNNLWLKLYNLPSHRSVSADHVFTTQGTTTKPVQKFEKLVTRSKKLVPKPEQTVQIFKIHGDDKKIDEAIGGIGKIIKEKIIYEKLKDIKLKVSQLKDIKAINRSSLKSKAKLSLMKVGDMFEKPTKDYYIIAIADANKNDVNNSIPLLENNDKKVNKKLTLKNRSKLNDSKTAETHFNTYYRLNNTENRKLFRILPTDYIDYEIPIIKTDSVTIRKGQAMKYKPGDVTLAEDNDISSIPTENIYQSINSNKNINSRTETAVTNEIKQGINETSSGLTFSTILLKKLLTTRNAIVSRTKTSPKGQDVDKSETLTTLCPESASPESKCETMKMNQSESTSPESKRGTMIMNQSEPTSESKCETMTMNQSKNKTVPTRFDESEIITKCEATAMKKTENTKSLLNITNQFETTKCNSTINPNEITNCENGTTYPFIKTTNISSCSDFLSTKCPTVSCPVRNLDKDPDYFCAFTTKASQKVFYNNSKLIQLKYGYPSVNKTTECSTNNCDIECKTTCIDDDKLDEDLGDKANPNTRLTNKHPLKSTSNTFDDEGHVTITDWKRVRIEEDDEIDEEITECIVPIKDTTIVNYTSESGSISSRTSNDANLFTTNQIPSSIQFNTTNNNLIMTQSEKITTTEFISSKNCLDNSTSVDVTTQLFPNISSKTCDDTKSLETTSYKTTNTTTCEENLRNITGIAPLTNEQHHTPNQINILVQEDRNTNKDDKITLFVIKKDDESLRSTKLVSEKSFQHNTSTDSSEIFSKIEGTTSKNSLAEKSTKNHVTEDVKGKELVLLPKVAKVIGGEHFVSSFLSSINDKKLKEIVVNLRIADSINVNGSLKCIYSNPNKK